MVRVLNFLIRYFSNYYVLHRSDLAAQAAPLDPRLPGYKNKILGYSVSLFFRESTSILWSHKSDSAQS